MIVAITGVSCSGKTPLAYQLPGVYFDVMISHTDRPQRPGEIPGFDYHFTSIEEMDQLISEGEFIEHTTFCGYRYGLSVNALLSTEKFPVHVCSPSGMKALRDWADETKTPFIAVFCYADSGLVIKRMMSRWQKDKNLQTDYLAKRLASALVDEPSWSGEYQYLVDQPDDINATCIALGKLAHSGNPSPPARHYDYSVPYDMADIEEYLSSVLRSLSRPRNHDSVTAASFELQRHWDIFIGSKYCA